MLLPPPAYLNRPLPNVWLSKLAFEGPRPTPGAAAVRAAAAAAAAAAVRLGGGGLGGGAAVHTTPASVSAQHTKSLFG